jgi:calcineurin-like phosphoesterase family protein
MNPLDKDPWQEIPVPTWVTSDTHLGHVNIRTYCPWRATWSRDIQQHDELIIRAWNEVVGQDEWVLHLGDFAMGPRSGIGVFRARLLGRIILVHGNHDPTRTKLLAHGLDIVVPRGHFRVDERRIACIHDACALTVQEAAGAAVVLHGHSHGNLHRGALPAHLVGKAVDCGIDAMQSLAPVPLAEVMRRDSGAE